MSLYFENVALLSYTHTPVFFDAGIRFKVQKNFTIRGTLLDKSASSGVKKTWDKAAILSLAASDDYQPIILNGIDFGSGKIVSVNFEAGDHVRQQNYSYTIQAYSAGNLFNALQGPY